MDPVVTKLKIHALSARLELSHLQCASLVEQFNGAQSPEEKNRLACRWDRAVQEGRALRFQLGLLKQAENAHRRQPGREAGA